MVYEAIKKLVQYGMETGLITETDRIYAVNQILDVLHLEEYEEPETEYSGVDLEQTLGELLDYACSQGIIEDSIGYRDLFDTRLMNCLMPRPSEVSEKFWGIYHTQGAEAATDYFYKLSQDSDYIRRYRVCKDQKWVTGDALRGSGYHDQPVKTGERPEGDCRGEAGKTERLSQMPPLHGERRLCRTAEPSGAEQPPIIRITVNNSEWGFQYSPYVYYNEHCIVFNGQHTPMKIEKAAFIKLFDFVKQFPHYFLGSNADLPIVGGSILSHDLSGRALYLCDGEGAD